MYVYCLSFRFLQTFGKFNFWNRITNKWYGICLFVQGPDEGYVCLDCFSKLQIEGYRHKDVCSMEVPTTSPKRARLSCRREFSRKRHSKEALISMLSSNLRKSNYRRVFKLLLVTGAAARRAFRNVMGTVIAHEMSSCCRGNQQKFPTFNGSESVKSFTWNSMFTELRQTLPTLYAAVNSSMPNKLRKDKDELGSIL